MYVCMYGIYVYICMYVYVYVRTISRVVEYKYNLTKYETAPPCRTGRQRRWIAFASIPRRSWNTAQADSSAGRGDICTLFHPEQPKRGGGK